MAYLVPSLVAFRAEVNARYPNRDKASDGWIGDPAHQQTNSDHNPDSKGAVHAFDLDEDLDGNPADAGAEVLWLANYIRTRHDPRVKYVIYESNMFSSYATSTRKAWTWGPYTGTNLHSKHMHISVLSTVEGENNVSPWLPEEEDLATPAEVWAFPLQNKINGNPTPASELLGFAHRMAQEAKDGTDALKQQVAALEALVEQIAAPEVTVNLDGTYKIETVET